MENLEGNDDINKSDKLFSDITQEANAEDVFTQTHDGPSGLSEKRKYNFEDEEDFIDDDDGAGYISGKNHIMNILIREYTRLIRFQSVWQTQENFVICLFSSRNTFWLY